MNVLGRIHRAAQNHLALQGRQACPIGGRLAEDGDQKGMVGRSRADEDNGREPMMPPTVAHFGQYLSATNEGAACFDSEDVVVTESMGRTFFVLVFVTVGSIA